MAGIGFRVWGIGSRAQGLGLEPRDFSSPEQKGKLCLLRGGEWKPHQYCAGFGAEGI